MKKCFVLFSIIFVTSLCVLGNGSLASALRNCSAFSESGTVNTEGMNVESRKQIVGWEGDKCIYKESVNFSGINVDITCRFTRAQITELSSVMNAYELLQGYSSQNVDTSNVSAVQDNPVVKAWNKYIQDASVCSMRGLEQSGFGM